VRNRKKKTKTNKRRLWKANSLQCLLTYLLTYYLERLTLARLRPYLTGSKNFSALVCLHGRTLHRDCTSLLDVLDSTDSEADENHATVLIGLDLSAAFNTVCPTRHYHSGCRQSSVCLEWYCLKSSLTSKVARCSSSLASVSHWNRICQSFFQFGHTGHLEQATNHSSWSEQSACFSSST